MKEGTKNEATGALHEAKGAVKEAAGKLTNNNRSKPKAPSRSTPARRRRKSDISKTRSRSTSTSNSQTSREDGRRGVAHTPAVRLTVRPDRHRHDQHLRLALARPSVVAPRGCCGRFRCAPRRVRTRSAQRTEVSEFSSLRLARFHGNRQLTLGASGGPFTAA